MRPSTESTEPDVQEIELREGVIGTIPSAHGLPAHLDTVRSGVVLFLSPVCKVCGTLADGFDGRVPEEVTVVIAAANSDRMQQWTAEHGLSPGDVVLDDDYLIVDSLGVTASPIVVGLAEGKIAFALGITNPAGLERVLGEHDIYAAGFEPLYDRKESATAEQASRGDGDGYRPSPA